MFVRKGEIVINYNEVVAIGDTHLLTVVSGMFELEGYEIQRIPAHDGGRNVVYTCEKEGEGAKMLRIAFLPDRSREDFLSEVEFVRYLFEHGGSVSNIISSRKGNLLEEITHNNHIFFVCLFEKAKGKMLVENNYRYREGVPITEYYYNCGKTLGRLHQISKGYIPVQRRYSFFDKYNAEYIDKLIPCSLSLLKKKMVELLDTLQGLNRDQETFGMIHFDYNDGNYSIDFDNGHITVYDFDNSCFGWYMFDLVSIWGNGVGIFQIKYPPATCFPSAAGLANSWNRELIRRLGRGCQAEGVAVLLGPGANIITTLGSPNGQMHCFRSIRRTTNRSSCGRAFSTRIHRIWFRNLETRIKVNISSKKMPICTCRYFATRAYRHFHLATACLPRHYGSCIIRFDSIWTDSHYAAGRSLLRDNIWASRCIQLSRRTGSKPL